MLKASQVRTNRAAFLAGVDVQAAGELRRLVGDHADRVALDAAETDHDVRREQLVHLEELAVVDDAEITSWMS
ncbi:hypothetical protein GCM10018954_040410 [Kutzneria kofuensis]